MKEKDFAEQLISQVRERLGRGGISDDEEARELIIDMVFTDSRAEYFTTDQLKYVIEKLFYMTRSKLGILAPLMEDRQITEIMINGKDHIFIEKNGEIDLYSEKFTSVEELEEVMRNIASQVHREINEMNPIVDARLADGSRVNGVYKNVAINGPILTIRKFSDKYMTLESLAGNGTISEEGMELLSTLVACRYNIFISGGTSSGKTTFLNALADYIPKKERIIVIEDSSELKLNNVENIVHLECKNSNMQGRGQVDMAQLIRSSLRMRPDRIIVGEVRGKEVLDMLQAMNTGHAGSMSTGHGNSIEGMLQRLETLYMMAMALGREGICGQIAEAIDIMIHVERMENGKRRVVDIAEIAGYRDGNYVINRLMKLDADNVLRPEGNKLVNTRKILLKGGENADRLRKLGFID